MEPTPELIDQLYREEVEAARRMSIAEKLMEGPRLFDRSCAFMLAGLKHEHPSAGDLELRKLLEERLDLLKSLENHCDQ